MEKINDATVPAESSTISIERNVFLVDNVLRKLFKNCSRTDREEAKAEGYLALCQAADKYDPDRGSFRRYAGRVIYNRMIDFRYGLSFQRVGIVLTKTNLRFLARLEKRSRVLGHWPEYDEVEIKSVKYTPTLHTKLKDYYESTIVRTPQSLTNELAGTISTDRRVGAGGYGPLVQEQTAGDHTRP